LFFVSIPENALLSAILFIVSIVRCAAVTERTVAVAWPKRANCLKPRAPFLHGRLARLGAGDMLNLFA